jgi:hypothetical protein
MELFDKKDARKPMTFLEKQLFKEAVIREYKQSIKTPNNPMQDFFGLLRKIAPINIVIGLSATALLVYLRGWKEVFGLLVTGIVWVSLISTALAALSKKK